MNIASVSFGTVPNNLSCEIVVWENEWRGEDKVRQ